MTQMDAADRHVPCGDSCEAVQWATGRAKYQDLSQMVSSAGSRKDRWLRPLGITRSALQTHSCAKIGFGACGSGSTPPTFGGAGFSETPKCEAGKTPHSSSGLRCGCPLPGASMLQVLGTQLNR